MVLAKFKAVRQIFKCMHGIDVHASVSSWIVVAHCALCGGTLTHMHHTIISSMAIHSVFASPCAAHCSIFVAFALPPPRNARRRITLLKHAVNIKVASVFPHLCAREKKSSFLFIYFSSFILVGVASAFGSAQWRSKFETTMCTTRYIHDGCEYNDDGNERKDAMLEKLWRKQQARRWQWRGYRSIFACAWLAFFA